MFRSRRCQAGVARALLARVGLERLWGDAGPTPEARLLLEAEHLPLPRRERALWRAAAMDAPDRAPYSRAAVAP